MTIILEPGNNSLLFTGGCNCPSLSLIQLCNRNALNSLVILYCFPIYYLFSSYLRTHPTAHLFLVTSVINTLILSFGTLKFFSAAEVISSINNLILSSDLPSIIWTCMIGISLTTPYRQIIYENKGSTRSFFPSIINLRILVEEIRSPFGQHTGFIVSTLKYSFNKCISPVRRLPKRKYSHTIIFFGFKRISSLINDCALVRI